MPGPEATVERDSRRYAEANQCRLVKRKVRGEPDRELQIPKHITKSGLYEVIYIEFKKPSATASDVSPQQRERIRWLREAGATVVVVTSYPQFIKLLRGRIF